MTACYHPTAVIVITLAGADTPSFTMVRTCCLVVLLLSVGATHAAFAQTLARSDTPSDVGDLESLTRLLLENIQALSDYRSSGALPPIFQLPQHAIELKVCDEPCNVSAAYIPREGIYLAANLDPVRDPSDRSALLHELVHYLQQGHPKFAGLSPCERERSKEQEAYAIQNAYLASIESKERVVFYAGDFDCEDDAAQR